MEECCEPIRVVEAIRRGEPRPFEDAGTGLYLPDDFELLAQGVVLYGGERDDVLRRLAVRGKCRARDLGDDELSPSDLYELSLLRNRRRRCFDPPQ